jgi:hypothetical protein
MKTVKEIKFVCYVAAKKEAFADTIDIQYAL